LREGLGLFLEVLALGQAAELLGAFRSQAAVFEGQFREPGLEFLANVLCIGDGRTFEIQLAAHLEESEGQGSLFIPIFTVLVTGGGPLMEASQEISALFEERSPEACFGSTSGRGFDVGPFSGLGLKPANVMYDVEAGDEGGQGGGQPQDPGGRTER